GGEPCSALQWPPRKILWPAPPMSSNPEKPRLWQRLLRSHVFWFLAGSILASIFWVWKYDPFLFGLTANAPHPIRPPEPGPGTIVVQPLAQKWDFENEKVPWAPI